MFDVNNVKVGDQLEHCGSHRSHTVKSIIEDFLVIEGHGCERNLRIHAVHKDIAAKYYSLVIKEAKVGEVWIDERTNSKAHVLTVFNHEGKKWVACYHPDSKICRSPFVEEMAYFVIARKLLTKESQ